MLKSYLLDIFFFLVRYQQISKRCRMKENRRLDDEIDLFFWTISFGLMAIPTLSKWAHNLWRFMSSDVPLDICDLHNLLPTFWPVFRQSPRWKAEDDKQFCVHFDDQISNLKALSSLALENTRKSFFISFISFIFIKDLFLWTWFRKNFWLTFGFDLYLLNFSTYFDRFTSRWS